MTNDNHHARYALGQHVTLAMEDGEYEVIVVGFGDTFETLILQAPEGLHKPNGEQIAAPGYAWLCHAIHLSRDEWGSETSPIHYKPVVTADEPAGSKLVVDWCTTRIDHYRAHLTIEQWEAMFPREADGTDPAELDADELAQYESDETLDHSDTTEREIIGWEVRNAD